MHKAITLVLSYAIGVVLVCLIMISNQFSKQMKRCKKENNKQLYDEFKKVRKIFIIAEISIALVETLVVIVTF